MENQRTHSSQAVEPGTYSFFMYRDTGDYMSSVLPETANTSAAQNYHNVNPNRVFPFLQLRLIMDSL